MKKERESRCRKKEEEHDVIKWSVAAEIFKSTGGKGAAEPDEGEGGVNQMRLYPQS